MLAFGSLFLMGSYFCYDIPSQLSYQFKETSNYHMTEFEYSSLYSIYSLPNTILPLLGGVLLDKTGIR